MHCRSSVPAVFASGFLGASPALVPALAGLRTQSSSLIPALKPSLEAEGVQYRPWYDGPCRVSRTGASNSSGSRSMGHMSGEGPAPGVGSGPQTPHQQTRPSTRCGRSRTAARGACPKPTEAGAVGGSHPHPWCPGPARAGAGFGMLGPLDRPHANATCSVGPVPCLAHTPRGSTGDCVLDLARRLDLELPCSRGCRAVGPVNVSGVGWKESCFLQ